MADRIGTEIAGYRIVSLLARGGMGEVYLATQAFPERKVALKLLPHELATDQAFRERFIRESNAAASVEHASIVPVYGAGESDGELWIAMRYVEGEDLRSLLDREAPLDPERAISICAQVADALEEAHEHGLVHRDVKPGNILLAKSDRAYLSDFGLIRRSKLETDLTKTGQFMGTVDYVAPEQIRGEPVDRRVDVYLARLCALRVPNRTASVRPGHGGGHAVRAPGGPPAHAAPEEPRRTRVPRRRGGEGDGQAAGGPLPGRTSPSSGHHHHGGASEEGQLEATIGDRWCGRGLCTRCAGGFRCESIKRGIASIVGRFRQTAFEFSGRNRSGESRDRLDDAGLPSRPLRKSETR